MITKVSVTAGITENKGRKNERFRAYPDGPERQVYIQFDNGSVLGVCKPEDINTFIATSARDFEYLPDTPNY